MGHEKYIKYVQKNGHTKIKRRCICRLNRIQERVKVIIMTITIAGNKKEYEEGVTVEQLIEKENVENPLYVTVTINDDFVNRGKFGETVLKDGDAVEFLYFMGGGAR